MDKNWCANTPPNKIRDKNAFKQKLQRQLIIFLVITTGFFLLTGFLKIKSDGDNFEIGFPFSFYKNTRAAQTLIDFRNLALDIFIYLATIFLAMLLFKKSIGRILV